MDLNSSLPFDLMPVISEFLMQINVFITHILFDFPEQPFGFPILVPDLDNTLDTFEFFLSGQKSL